MKLHCPHQRNVALTPQRQTAKRVFLPFFAVCFLVCADVSLFAEFGSKLSAASSPKAFASFVPEQTAQRAEESLTQDGAVQRSIRAARAELDEGIRKKLTYPEKARRRRIEGTVILHYTVNADGTLKELSVVPKAAGTAETAAAAVSALPPEAILVNDAQKLFQSLFPLTNAPAVPFSGEIAVVYKL